jgi:hypothetical protein
MLQILQTPLQEWAAEVALHHGAGSKKLIKHFRPPKLGNGITISTIEEAEATYVAERPRGTKADGLWLLRHITVIATKRNYPARVLEPRYRHQ